MSLTETREELRAAPGEIAIALRENRTTAFVWRLARASDGVVSIGDDFALGDASVGGGGVHTFRFRIDAPGTYELVFELGRRWEPDPIARHDMRVIVA
jgi:predicted secreted protein